MYFIPAAMIVISLTIVNNVLLLIFGITWLGTAIFIHYVQ